MGSRTRLAGALRTAILPGWGQWIQGRRALGLILLLSVLVPLGVPIWVAGTNPTTAASWLVTPDAILALLLLNVFLLGLRAWGVWDAWSGGSRHSGRWWLVGLLVAVAIPHVGVGWLQVRTVQALETVFAAPAGSSTTTATSPVVMTTAEPVISTPPPSDSPTTTRPASTTTATPLPPWGEHLTVLLLGGDGASDRPGIRTDAMLIMNVTTGTGDLALFSLPRNLRAFPFAEVPEFSGILNEVYLQGHAFPGAFEGSDPGAAAIVSVAEQITGLDIDYYAMLDFYAFVSVVDAMGGVTVSVPHQILYPEYRLEDGSIVSITIEPGVRQLSGDEALAFVRSRKTGSDYGRMERQRCLISALISQSDLSSLLRSLPSLITTFEERVTTDIPLPVLPEMLKVVEDIRVEEAAVASFGPPLWHRGWVEGGWPVPDVERIKAAVAQVIAGDPSVLGAEAGVTAGSVCDLP